jgi:hypothetical protein
MEKKHVVKLTKRQRELEPIRKPVAEVVKTFEVRFWAPKFLTNSATLIAPTRRSLGFRIGS